MVAEEQVGGRAGTHAAGVSLGRQELVEPLVGQAKAL
jgi:hypothetical protein